MFRKIRKWKALIFEVVETLITLCLFMSHQPKYTCSQRNQFLCHADMLSKLSVFLKEDVLDDIKKEAKNGNKSKANSR